MGLRLSHDGFVGIQNLLSLMQKRYPWLDRRCLEEIVDQDEKGRYELKGKKIRARYGHSIDVSVDFPPTDLETLYHGTSNHLAKEIPKEGLILICFQRDTNYPIKASYTLNPLIVVFQGNKCLYQGIFNSLEALKHLIGVPLFPYFVPEVLHWI